VSKDNHKLLRKLISKLLQLEALFHFIFPIISLYGIIVGGVYDWKIIITPLFDIIFGCVCLVASWLLGEHLHHHH
jgi:hypothetical protein